MPDPVVIIPLHNHSATVCDVLDGVHAAGLKAIVVDDGSTDGGGATVERWVERHPGAAELLRLERNQGKAAALIRGMRAAESRGASVAITIDADGQHDATRLRAFAEAASDGNTLVLGNRVPIPPGYPLARLVGRMLSSIAVRAACGAMIHDAACGFRAYPIPQTRSVRCMGGRYAWEEEIVSRLVWRGVAIREIAIPVIYREPGIARSHYRFLRDWPEGTAVLVWAIAVRVLDPRARWCRQGPGVAAMAWPAWPGDALGMACAAMAAGVAATIALAARALEPMATAPLAAGAAAVVIAWAAVRVRASAVTVLAGGALGWFAPLPLAMACLPVSVALAVWSISRLRHGAR